MKEFFSFHLFTFVYFFLNFEDVFFKLHNQYYHIIREEDWLCTKDIDRKEAIELLSKHPEDGTFLVRQRSSSSHVFTIPESTNLRKKYTKLALFCFSTKFSIEIKNAEITVFHK